MIYFRFLHTADVSRVKHVYHVGIAGHLQMLDYCLSHVVSSVQKNESTESQSS